MNKLSEVYNSIKSVPKAFRKVKPTGNKNNHDRKENKK